MWGLGAMSNGVACGVVACHAQAGVSDAQAGVSDAQVGMSPIPPSSTDGPMWSSASNTLDPGTPTPQPPQTVNPIPYSTTGAVPLGFRGARVWGCQGLGGQGCGDVRVEGPDTPRMHAGVLCMFPHHLWRPLPLPWILMCCHMPPP